ncbi:MAG TPA: tetratricopeptide repeat protein [Vicinamibacterales bacterium]|nr:tetratricopeptide repeat protein [Vicinamibacterales bacterium]
MPIALFLAAFVLQTRPAATTPPEKIAEAYTQFLLAHRLEEGDDPTGAIAAYKKAIELDPTAADVPAELAALYLKQGRYNEAEATATQALKVAPANREANRVLGIVFATRVDDGNGDRPPRNAGSADENVKKSIQHLELAIQGAVAESDPNIRATLARLYLRSEQYDKAIGLLGDLVRQEPGWSDGPLLLTEAYASAGRTADAIAWLEQQTEDDPRLLPALADFYERARNWPKAADTYAKAVKQAPRSVELRRRYASALLNAGGRDNATKARDVLSELTATGRADAQQLYLLSQAQRRAGDAKGAEETARKVIAQNSNSPWGYYALAEALEERHQYQAVVDALAPVIASHANDAAKSPTEQAFDSSILLPHLAFAYQELGDNDKAIAAFTEARRRSPQDPNIAGYLVEANIAAKKYQTAIDVAKAARTDHPDDLRLARLQAQALQKTGKANEGVAILESAMKAHADEPSAYVSLAQLYSDANRGSDAVRVLQEAQQKFPDDASVVFELGTVYDKQKKYVESEAVFQQILKKDPQNAAALNYLGYMLAERGERLDESVNLLKKALQLEPENGSYLDSLGWAYFKSDKLDLAEDNLRKAAEQQRTNSVIQEHYGEVLLKLGRYADAVTAFTRALDGDGSDIDRADVSKKLQAAKSKIKR